MNILQEGKRLLRLMVGLFLYALGMYIRVQANVGLAPWDAFHQGVSLLSGISMDNVITISGMVIILLDLLSREQVGLGTILNALLVGQFYNLIAAYELIPVMEGMAEGLVLMVVGMLVIALASFFYIGAEYGCGPRDSLMVAICRKLPGDSVGLARGGLEGGVLMIGWLFGANVGIGTLVSVLAIGMIIQLTFRLLHFDVKALKHENIIETGRRWFRAKANA